MVITNPQWNKINYVNFLIRTQTLEIIMGNWLRIKLLFIIVNLGSWISAQGISFPDQPTQAPFGGLWFLAILGGAMAYNKLKNKK